MPVVMLLLKKSSSMASLGLELLQQLVHVVGDLEEPGGQGLTRRGSNGAALDQPGLAPHRLHQAEAHNGKAGVDP